MDKDRVLSLAKLARIEIGEKEAGKLSQEFAAILGYVGEVKEIANDKQLTTDNIILKNVMREDGKPHESGIYTEDLLNNAPEREGNYFKVKKIL